MSRPAPPAPQHGPAPSPPRTPAAPRGSGTARPPLGSKGETWERRRGTVPQLRLPVPAASDSASRPAPLGLRRHRPCRPSSATRPPYHGCSPGRTGSAWTAPERPQQQLRADLARPPAPPPECGQAGGGAYTSAGRGAGAGHAGAGLTARDPDAQRVERRSAQGRTGHSSGSTITVAAPGSPPKKGRAYLASPGAEAFGRSRGLPQE